MTYTSVEEMISAGITNMEVIRNNVGVDSGVDTIVGVDWFTFNGVVASSIYVNADSYFGFGSSSYHLTVNNRDAKIWYLYREEGQIGGTKFLKIRWSGYSRYNYTTAQYQLIYDVVLFDNGNIYLHMDTIPTSRYDGSFYLNNGTTYNYTKPTVESPNVLFTHNEDGTYTVSYEMPYIPVVKYLARVGKEIYTKVDGVIQSLGDVEVNALLFQEQGVYDLFTSEELVPLGFPEILVWNDVGVHAIPKFTTSARPIANQQIITDAISFEDETIKGIEAVTVDCDGDLIAAVSFDKKATWKAWNGTEWVSLDSQFSGMSKETLEAITIDQWVQLYEGATEMFIRLSFINTEQVVRQIYVDFLN